MKNPHRNSYGLKVIRIEVMDRFDWNCILCGDNAKHVHHCDKIHENNDFDNLISLCVSCHIGYFHARDKKRRLFSFYILRGLFARLQAMAKKEDCSISSLLETASSEFLDRRE